MTQLNSPFLGRDLTTRLLFPTLSWSSFNAFTDYDKELWYKSYVLGEKGPTNAVMRGGIWIGEKIANDPTFLPSIPRGGIFEQEFKAKLGTINLVGHLDQWWPAEGIDEFKTSANSKRWTQKAVDGWGQITFYCLLVWLIHKIPPDKLRLRLYWIPTRENGGFAMEVAGKPVVFETKRSMADVLRFAQELKVVHKEMQDFIAKKEYDEGIKS